MAPALGRRGAWSTRQGAGDAAPCPNPIGQRRGRSEGSGGLVPIRIGSRWGEFLPRSRLDREGRGSGVVGGSGSGCPRVSADGEDMGSGVGRPRWWPGGPRPMSERGWPLFLF